MKKDPKNLFACENEQIDLLKDDWHQFIYNIYDAMYHKIC